MNIITYSHNYGEYAISQQEISLIVNRLKTLNVEFKLNSAAKLRKTILDSLMMLGWSDKVRIDTQSNITITAMKKDVGLCLQTGNMGRFYADVLKLEALFRMDKATAAIYILPTKLSAKKLGSNIASFERFIEELNMYKHIITIPILTMGIE